MAKTRVFIDSRVNDQERLISQFISGTEFSVVDASRNGIEQILGVLSTQSGYDSIQIISHGISGSITIGSTVLNSSNLDFYAQELSLIGNAMNDNGDLLLYGCKVGAGENGQQFIQTLSQLTGADVAASDDLTGGASTGGDWKLEVTTGLIESAIPLSYAALEQYAHTLSGNSYPLIPDTNPADTLLDTFTISGSETGRLNDDDSNGTIDRLEYQSTYIDQSGVTQTRTDNFALVWSDSTNFTAHALQPLSFGSQYDGNGQPLTIFMNGSELTIVYQAKDADNVIATVSFTTQQNNTTVPAFLQFIDNDGDNIPDHFTYSEGTGSSIFTVAGSFVNWLLDGSNRPTAVTAFIETSSDPMNVFAGSVTLSGSVPTDIMIPSFNGSTSGDTLSSNILSFDTGISSPVLASSGLITVRDANPGGGIISVTLSVTSLSLNGSWLSVPMSGTDSSGNPYSLAYSGGTKLMVQMPAGIIEGQTDPMTKAWQVSSMNNGSYSLSTMTVMSSGTGTTGPDWFTGTSGNDSIDAGAGNDFIQWSGGNDTVNALSLIHI